MGVEITQAAPGRLSALASVLGRALVVEPTVRWSLGERGDVEERSVRGYEYFIADLIQLGMVWEAGEGMGALVWIPPDGAEVWSESMLSQSRMHVLTNDGGRRWNSFWEWVESKIPDEPLAHLDSVVVEPEAQGRGIGSALIEFGLARARAGKHGVFLETGAERNVALYKRLGFRIVDDADAPGGGPHIWFMRWDP